MEHSRSPTGFPDKEAPKSYFTGKHGGWITFPFIIGNLGGLTLGGFGWVSNLIVYLIEEFNVESIDAAQISSIVNGCSNLFPVIGAIVADSFLGSFSVISISSSIALLGSILLALTAIVESLKPHPCENGSSFCKRPSTLPYAVLYLGIALGSMGIGGTRFTSATMGANQLKTPKHQGIFFNWYFFTFYAAAVIGSTVIVYVEDNVSWGWGFGLCAALNLAGLIIFLLGSRFYQYDKPQGSPFSALARVLVAAIRKRKIRIEGLNVDYYYGVDGLTTMANATPKESFRFLNKAAVKTGGDTHSDNSIAKPWRLCTVEEVENLKSLVRILPLWSTGIFLSTPIAIQASLTVVQALAMDRHLGSDFQIPAGSVLVLVLISAAFSLSVMDRFMLPTWRKLTGWFPTPLQQIGVGHVLNILGMAVSAIVESQRLKMAKSGAGQQMLVVWLFPQLVLVGLGESFHFPGQVALYYQEFPAPLRSTATGVISLIIGTAFYLSTAVIELLRRITRWLPDDINHGRLDNVYWVVVVAGVINFGYYLVCAKWYRYQSVDRETDDGESNSRL